MPPRVGSAWTVSAYYAMRLTNLTRYAPGKCLPKMCDNLINAVRSVSLLSGELRYNSYYVDFIRVWYGASKG